MDGTHPNRKKDKLNPYTLSIENGTYYIAFADGQGVVHKIEISKELYAAFDRFELEDISHINVVSRHLTESDMGDGACGGSCMPQNHVSGTAQGDCAAPSYPAQAAPSVLFWRVHLRTDCADGRLQVSSHYQVSCSGGEQYQKIFFKVGLQFSR